MSVIFSPTVAGALFFIAFTINSSKGSASQSPSPRVINTYTIHDIGQVTLYSPMVI